MAGTRLAGKVAIVTGAGSRAEGIGNGRAGGEAAVCEADVTQSGDCRAMVEEAVRRWGRLDILDNNVGIGGRATVVDVEESAWEHMMRVNVTSMMLASKHA